MNVSTSSGSTRGIVRAIVAALAVGVLLTACSDDGDSSSSATSEAVTTTEATTTTVADTCADSEALQSSVAALAGRRRCRRGNQRPHGCGRPGQDGPRGVRGLRRRRAAAGRRGAPDGHRLAGGGHRRLRHRRRGAGRGRGDRSGVRRRRPSSTPSMPEPAASRNQRPGPTDPTGARSNDHEHFPRRSSRGGAAVDLDP